MDMTFETDRLSKPGETFIGNRFFTAPAGKGGNAAVAAARFAGDNACDVKMIGRVGKDSFGAEVMEFMRGEGVDVSGIYVDESIASGVALIIIDSAGENYVIAVYGANTRCDVREVEIVEEMLDGAGVLIVQQEIPLETTLAAMRIANSRDVPVILDPAPVRAGSELPDSFHSFADIITPNVIEAQSLSGIEVVDADSAERAAEKMRSDLKCEMVIVTMDSDGVFVLSDDISGHIPAFAVDVVSSVAAGDAFAGVLGRSLSEGFDIEDAICFAMAAGAICVSRPGAQDAMPSRAEVERLILSARSV